MGVQCRVDESNWVLVDIESCLVDSVDDRGEDGCARTGAARAGEISCIVGCDVVAVSCYIRISILYEHLSLDKYVWNLTLDLHD